MKINVYVISSVTAIYSIMYKCNRQVYNKYFYYTTLQ